MNHWYFIDLGYGAHAAFPGLAQFFEDEVELGRRVADAFDDEAIWGANSVVFFAAAPGGPWEGQ